MITESTALLESIWDTPAEPQMAELAWKQLQNDPQLVTAYVQQRRMALLLAGALRRRPGAEVAAQVRRVVADGRPRQAPVPSAGPRRRRPQLRPRAALQRLAIAAGIVMALGLSVVAFQATTTPGRFVASRALGLAARVPVAQLVSGHVLRSTDAPERLAAGRDLFLGDTLIQDTPEELLLRYSDGTTLTCVGPSQIRLAGDGTRKRVEITNGDILADVTPQPAAAPLLLHSSLAEVTVKGTNVRCVSGADGDRIDLHVGTVSVAFSDATTTQLTPGLSLLCHRDGTHQTATLAGPTLLFWDFEGATTLPAPWHDGQLSQGPPGTPAPPCVVGVPLNQTTHRYGIQIVDPPQTLFTYAPGQLLEFDYWASQDLPTFSVWIAAGHRADQSDIVWYQFPLGHLQHEDWTHVALRLDDLRPEANAPSRLQTGASVFNIGMNFDDRVRQMLYFDQVRISAGKRP